MKKIYSFLFAASALFAAASCQEELVDPTPEAPVEETMTITASSGAKTKTVLGEDGVSTFWTATDAISVFDSNKEGNNRKFQIVTENKEFPAPTATFALDNNETFVWPEDGQTDPLIVALYPYQEKAYCDFFFYDRNYIKDLKIPTEQVGVMNAFDPAATFGLATGRLSTKDNLTFNNLYTLLKITLKEEGVKEVKVEVDGENAFIAGEARVQLNLDATNKIFNGGALIASGSNTVTLKSEKGFEVGANYYIAIAPVTYTNLKVYLDEKLVKNTELKTPKTLLANKIYNISNLDDGVYLNGEDVYEISNETGLRWVAEQVNTGADYFAGKTIKLVKDIDLKNTEWTPIGSATADHGFMGNFDGNGYTIKNLKISNIAADADGYVYAGLFGVTEGVDKDNQNNIKNLIIENVNISTGGHIVTAAIAYPYYTVVEGIKVKGDINIKGGNYTSGVLAYTRRCVDAKNLTIEGNEGSKIEGNITVGGVISDIQMSGGLKANYSNFKASGLTIKGIKAVGGISGIIAGQTLDGATVEKVVIECENVSKGIVSGSLGGVSTIKNITVTNVTGADNVVGATYDDAEKVYVNGDTYSPYKVVSTVEELKNAVATCDKVQLAGDIEMSEILTLSKDITLDGAGHTLTSSAGRAINVDNSTALSVTIKNLKIESTGERAINIINGSHNVTIDKVVATTKNYAVMVATSAPNVKLSISNSDMTGMNVVNIAGKKTECQITNTNLTCIDNNNSEGYGAIAIYNTGVESKVEMKGGCITVLGEYNDSCAGYISADAASITLNDVQGENLEIEYGDYFIVYANQTAYSFSTLKAALEYAKDGETIYLSTDVELSETYSITKNITINLNGYDLDASANTSRPFNVENGKLTIEGGESNIKVGKYGLVNVPVGKNAEVILNGGIYEGNTDNGSFLKPRGEGKISFTLTGVKYTDSSTDGFIMDASSYNGSDVSVKIENCNFAAAGGLISVAGNVSIKKSEINTSGDDYKFASVEFSGKGTGLIEESTIKSTSSTGIAVSAGFGAAMEVKNSSATGQKFAYCVYQSGGTINVTGGTYEGPVGVYGELYDNASSDAKITINGDVKAEKKKQN